MATANNKSGPTNKGLRIHAKREIFYSAGIVEPFGFDPREIAFSDLKDEQVVELKADPFLVVVEVDIAPPKPKAE